MTVTALYHPLGSQACTEVVVSIVNHSTVTADNRSSHGSCQPASQHTVHCSTLLYFRNRYPYYNTTVLLLLLLPCWPSGRSGKLTEEVYGQDIMFVANDWHAALLPVMLTARFR